MQIFVAYAFDSAAVAGSLRERLARVDEHFRELWGSEVVQDGRDLDRDAPQLGIHLWHPAKSCSRWPAWHDAGGRLVAATAYPPVGYERIIGDSPPEESPARLAEVLARSPERVRDLVAPFAMAVLDSVARRLTVLNDAIGLGRVHEMRFPDGWVWSNRPVAACLFAGVRARADRRGWRHFACTSGFMDDAGPYERISYLPAGVQVVCQQGQPRRIQRCADGMGSWVGRRGEGLSESLLDEVTASLQQVARSVTRLWDRPITADLSGGRDSRVVVASFLSADVDVQLNTNGALAGEAVTAEHLVALLGRDIEHQISRPATGSVVNPAAGRDNAIDRVRRWFRYADAMRPSTYLPSQPPSTFAEVDKPHLSGVMGEVAHGQAYPENFAELAQLEHQARLDVCETKLLGSVGPIHGSSEVAREAVRERIRAVLREAASAGCEDATVLDYFWLAERLRRWGAAAERPGIVVPLADPQFLRAAFVMTPEERRQSALHRALLKRLIPQWADVPFFKPGKQDVLNVVRTRIWDEPDRDVITSIIMTPEVWADGFDVAAVQRAWRAGLAGSRIPRDEGLLQRVVWRTVFEDHLAELNGEPAPVRSPAFLPEGDGVAVSAVPRSAGAAPPDPRSAGAASAVSRSAGAAPPDPRSAGAAPPDPPTAPRSLGWQARTFTAKALRKAAHVVAPAADPQHRGSAPTRSV